MNLASILTLSVPTGTQPGAPSGVTAADPALLLEFSALLGLTVLPASVVGEAASGGKILPEAGGSELPPVDQLPLDPSSLLAFATFAPIALPPAQIVPPATLEAAASKGANVRPETAKQPATPAQPPSAPSAPNTPAGLLVQFDIRPTLPQVQATRLLPIEQQVRAPLPLQVHAQVQSETALAQQPDLPVEKLAAQQLAALPSALPSAGPQPSRRAPAATLPVPLVVDGAEALPEAVRAAPAPVITPAAVMVDTPRVTASETTAPLAASTAPADRHDFAAIVDRLAEARELARPGRAAMQLAHQDFGRVSVQFDLAGPSLKVALASADAGFAPAMQAALNDRPIAAGSDAARSDTSGQRPDQSALPPSAASSGAIAHNDSQRADQHTRGGQQQRTPAEHISRQPQAAHDADDTKASSRARDGSLFA